ncbi:hypothetical protein [Kozakia baliensis]|uniref:hypothetical protein n=1 Tax=Kozakia baliensis TaxID=153496 RepID=UPI000497B032|nr:hypothetical protein [Kozakia baliensis]
MTEEEAFVAIENLVTLTQKRANRVISDLHAQRFEFNAAYGERELADKAAQALRVLSRMGVAA